MTFICLYQLPSAPPGLLYFLCYSLPADVDITYQRERIVQEESVLSLFYKLGLIIHIKENF